jgi:hypothetical protein
MSGNIDGISYRVLLGYKSAVLSLQLTAGSHVYATVTYSQTIYSVENVEVISVLLMNIVINFV